MATIEVKSYAGTIVALQNSDLKQALYDEGAVIMADVLLTLHGDEHRRRRLLEFGVFRREFFRWYETEQFPHTLGETIAEALALGRADLVELGYRVTMNLTADFAGIDRPERSQRETEALLALVKTFSEGATLVHSTRDRDVVRREVREALDVFDTTFLAPSIERRQRLIAQFNAGAIGESELPRDVLTTILRNEEKVEMPRDVLRREIAFYLQAGAHSTANSTTHALNDILFWREAHADDAERMRRDPLFIQRCVHESFRLHPASPVSWRKAAVPTVLKFTEPISLAEGDRVVIDLAAANRDPLVFGPEAAGFNPHRRIPVGQLPFGLTFGSGVHSCLGRDLDGGVVPRGEVDPSHHQYGIVTLFLRRLLSAGARLDPDDPPEAASHTERGNFGRYPIIFDAKLRWAA